MLALLSRYYCFRVLFHVFPFFLISSQCPWAPCSVHGTRVGPDECRSLCHRSHFQPQSFCDSLIIYLKIVNSSFLYSNQYVHKITKWENHGITERSELDGTRKNHWVQLLAPHKTIKKFSHAFQPSSLLLAEQLQLSQYLSSRIGAPSLSSFW